jgi:hypothetical protein
MKKEKRGKRKGGKKKESNFEKKKGEVGKKNKK